MTGIDELLRQATADAPPDDLDPREMLSRGQRRVRQRRMRVVGGLAAVAAVVVAVPLALHLVAPRAQHPVADGPGLDLSAAESGEAGRDWTTQRRVTIGDLRDGSRSRPLTVLGLFQGGLVVARVDGRANVQRLGLLEGSRVRWLPRRTVGAFLGADGGRLVFGVAATADGQPVSPDPGYQVYDLRAGTWRSLPLSPVVDPEWPGSVQSQVVSGGMLYVGLDQVDDQPTVPLWRVSLDGRGAWQRVGTVGRFAVADGTLAYTRTLAGGGVVLRDVDSGAERRFTAAVPAGCRTNDISLSAGAVVLGLGCGASESSDGSAQRLVVLDHTGTTLATVRSARLQVSLVANDLVAFSVLGAQDGSDRALVGDYVVHLGSRRLVRLGDVAVMRDPSAPPSSPMRLWRHAPGAGGSARTVLFDVVVPR